MAKRVLIVGAGGQLAQALLAAAPPDTQCIGRTHADLDLCDLYALYAALEEVQPAFVINGAAYNLVDNAESEGMELALRTNALAVARLAAACRKADIPLVHFSTDLVFDGRKRTPYTEEDMAQPLGVYGASKLAGENMALAASPRNLVIRVQRLFGPSSAASDSSKKPVGNFPLLMLYLAHEKGTVRVVDDQIGSPTYMPDLAKAVWQLTDLSQGGLFQLSNAGEVSFADYAHTIFRLACVSCEVESMASEAYGAAARRPLYSTLSNTKAHERGVTPLRHWREALEEFMQQL